MSWGVGGEEGTGIRIIRTQTLEQEPESQVGGQTHRALARSLRLKKGAICVLWNGEGSILHSISVLLSSLGDIFILVRLFPENLSISCFLSTHLPFSQTPLLKAGLS